GATWNLQNGATISGGAGGTFTNQVTFSVSSGTNSIAVPFNNSNTVNALSGKLALTGGGTSTGGSFSASSGATLGFDSSYTLNNTPVSGAGIGEFGAGTLTRTSSAYSLTGGLQGNGGTVTFGSGDTVGGNVSMASGGTITVGSGTTVSTLTAMTSVSLTGGTLNYSGGSLSPFTGLTVTVTSGTLNLNSGVTLPSLGAVTVGNGAN